MVKNTEPLPGLTPTRLEARPTAPLEETLKELFLNDDAREALNNDGHLTLLSRQVAYLDLNESSEEYTTDLSSEQEYSQSLENYYERVFEVGLPVTKQARAARRLQIGMTVSFGSNWERSLLVGSPLFHEVNQDFDGIPGLEMYVRFQRSQLVAESAIASAYAKFKEEMESAQLGQMQATNFRVVHDPLRLMED